MTGATAGFVLSMSGQGWTRQQALRVLHVSKKDAGPDDIKDAYKHLVLKWHPDKNQSPEASARFQAVQAAFDFLKTSTTEIIKE